MCYFDQIRWSCGYWRWSHFRQQCTKEYRTGETCGLKLVYDTEQRADTCKLCKDIEKKQRKYLKHQSDVARWSRQTDRNASIERAQEEMGIIVEAINNMSDQHSTRVYSTA